MPSFSLLFWGLNSCPYAWMANHLLPSQVSRDSVIFPLGCLTSCFCSWHTVLSVRLGMSCLCLAHTIPLSPWLGEIWLEGPSLHCRGHRARNVEIIGFNSRLTTGRKCWGRQPLTLKKTDSVIPWLGYLTSSGVPFSLLLCQPPTDKQLKNG